MVMGNDRQTSRKLILARATILLAVVALLGVVPRPAFGQDGYFGKNKVQYGKFSWSYIESDHFDIYFYDGGYNLALFSAAVLESAYTTVSQQLNHRLNKRVPVIVYQSHNDFQQTNVTSALIEEGVGGFTESFKNRIVVPFTGSYEDFRHVLHHELTHAVMFDLLYGNILGSLFSRRYMFSLPTWFAEGFAEYSSRRGWDSFADMVVRDAVIHDYLIPLEYIEGFLAYKEGQSAILYLSEKYGQEKISEILQKSMTELSLDNGLKKSIGMNTKDFYEDWSRRLRKTYWPEISIREEPRDFAKYLTDHTKDGSLYNEKPVFAPSGNELAIFTDQSDYTEIRIISAVDGKVIKKAVKGDRSADFESLHSYVSGMAWSPDGGRLAFVSKSKGQDALIIYSLARNKTEKRWRFGLGVMRSPAWSPDGKTIVFNGWRHGNSDLYALDLETGKLDQLTNDRYDEQEPAFSPDGKYLAFASDRPAVDGDMALPDTASAFVYGSYNIFLVDRATSRVRPLTVAAGKNQSPAFSPDSRRLAFVSDRNGIYNVYVHELDSGIVYPITNSISGCFTPSWSPNGEQLAFSGFYRGGFDIFVMRELRPKAAPGESLALTELARTWAGLDSAGVFAFGPRGAIEQKKIEQLETEQFTGYSFRSSAIRKRALFDSTTVAGDTLNAESVPDTVGRTADTAYADVFHQGPRIPQVWNPTLGRYEPDVRPIRAGPAPDTVNGVVQYQQKKYKLRFTPDLAAGNTGYDPFFGLRGQIAFLMSDYLGDHQFFLYTDLINTIDQSNFQLLYFYTGNRTDYGVGIFHTKYYYDWVFPRFSDRTYGMQWLVSRPFSKFTRGDFGGWLVFIDRRYYDFFSPGDPRGDYYQDRSDRVFVGTWSLVHDNVVWGLTGPVNGRRYRVDVEYAPEGVSKGIAYQAASFDYRQYWHIKRRYDFAARVSGGLSGGENPKIFFMGGVSNWIGSTVDNDAVYQVEGLYFSELITPLRGYDYYEFAGTRYALLNLEFRYPFIDYLQMRFPLPMTLAQVKGAMFYDMGAAWYDDQPFKGGTSSNGPGRLQDIRAAFGFGMRANLGFLVLRFDTAWPTNLNTVARRPHYYFSLGGDF